MINKELIEKLQVITEEEKKILETSKVDRSIYMSGEAEGMAFGEIDGAVVLKNGKMIDIRPHTRFVHFPPHTHNFIEMVYMCKGSTTHIISGERVVLSEGELLFLSPNAVQEILPATEEDIAVNFIIMPQFFERIVSLSGIVKGPIGEFLLGALSGKADFLHFKVSSSLPIQNLVENLIWSIESEGPNKRSINEITMSLLIITLTGYAHLLGTDQNSPENEIYLKALDYIEKNYKTATLEELADMVHYDVYYISRVIKRLSGQTFTDLLKQKRLSRACWLLRFTSMAASEVSLAVGYENKSYFYRIFTEYTGVTPAAYRKGNGNELQERTLF